MNHRELLIEQGWRPFTKADYNAYADAAEDALIREEENTVGIYSEEQGSCHVYVYSGEFANHCTAIIVDDNRAILLALAYPVLAKVAIRENVSELASGLIGEVVDIHDLYFEKLKTLGFEKVF